MATKTSSTATLTGARRGSLVALRYLALAFAAVAILVMIPLAGVGVFGLEGRTIDDAGSFTVHAIFGYLLWLVSLIMIVLAVIARPGALLIVLPIVLFVLMFLQGPFTDVGAALGWLHPLNGIIAAGLAGLLAVRAKERLAGSRTAR